jgi:hypothetical protein
MVRLVGGLHCERQPEVAADAIVEAGLVDEFTHPGPDGWKATGFELQGDACGELRLQSRERVHERDLFLLGCPVEYFGHRPAPADGCVLAGLLPLS